MYRLIDVLRQADKIIGKNYSKVKLSSINALMVQKRGNLFPYYVTIEGNDIDAFRDLLVPLTGWLGIGIVLSERYISTFYSSCMASGGESGRVGGQIVLDTNKPILVTCSHVLGPACGEAEFMTRPQSSGTTSEPDIALLSPLYRCFSKPRRVTSVIPHKLSAVDFGKIKCIKTPSGNPTGVLYRPVGLVEISGRKYEFPHAEILSDVKIWFDLFIWPPWQRMFSKQGDSGSWVISSDEMKWLGIVVSGNRFTKVSDIVIASAAVEYLQNVLNWRGDTKACAWRD